MFQAMAQVVSDAVAKGDVQALNYFVAQKYTEAIGKVATAPGQKTLLLPVEATSLIGSLTGIAELAKATFGEDAARPTSGRVPTTGSGND